MAPPPVGAGGYPMGAACVAHEDTRWASGGYGSSSSAVYDGDYGYDYADDDYYDHHNGYCGNRYGDGYGDFGYASGGYGGAGYGPGGYGDRCGGRR